MKVTFGSYPKLLIKDQDKLLFWLNVANVKALTNEKMRFKTWLRKISVAEPEPPQVEMFWPEPKPNCWVRSGSDSCKRDTFYTIKKIGSIY